MKFGQWVGLLALLIALYMLWKIRQILLLFFVAIVLATALNRLVQRFQRSGMRRSVAVFAAATLFFLCFVTFVGLVIPPFIEQLQRFVVLLPSIFQAAEAWLQWFQSKIPEQISRDFYIFDVLNQQSQLWIIRLLDNVFTIFSDVLAIALKLLLVFVLAVMLLINPQQYREPFKRIFPAFYRHRVDVLLTKCEADLVGWVTGSGFTMLFVAILSGLGLMALQLPLVLASALWAGFAELIPNLSWIIAVIPPLIIALLDSPWKAAIVVALYFFIQQLESYLIVPMVMKKQASLSPAITLFAQLIFVSFFGFLGLFLALPLMVLTRIVVQDVLISDVLDQWHRTKTSNEQK